MNECSNRLKRQALQKVRPGHKRVLSEPGLTWRGQCARVRLDFNPWADVDILQTPAISTHGATTTLTPSFNCVAYVFALKTWKLLSFNLRNAPFDVEA